MCIVTQATNDAVCTEHGLRHDWWSLLVPITVVVLMRGDGRTSDMTWLLKCMYI